MNETKIVVVEDDQDMLDLIVRALGKDDRLEVVCDASDARSAAECVRRENPSVIVLDHYLFGEIMGIDSAPVMKTLAPNARVIVFTTEDLGLEAHLQPDVDAYLRKDELERLLPLVQKLALLEAR